MNKCYSAGKWQLWIYSDHREDTREYITRQQARQHWLKVDNKNQETKNGYYYYYYCVLGGRVRKSFLANGKGFVYDVNINPRGYHNTFHETSQARDQYITQLIKPNHSGSFLGCTESGKERVIRYILSRTAPYQFKIHETSKKRSHHRQKKH